MPPLRGWLGFRPGNLGLTLRGYQVICHPRKENISISNEKTSSTTGKTLISTENILFN